MNHFFEVLILGAAMATLSVSPTVAQCAPEMPSWMAGNWEKKSGDDWVYESWTQPRGGVMLGSSVTGEGGAAVFFEFLRLQKDEDGVLTYWGSPAGQPATPFKLVSSDAQSAVFVNPQHDYPQRITYRREGDLLEAEISLADGTNAERWTYRRVD